MSEQQPLYPDIPDPAPMTAEAPAQRVELSTLAADIRRAHAHCREAMAAGVV